MTNQPSNNRGRFRQGVSGNPKGRPKGTRNRKSTLDTECELRLMVTENGQRKRMTKWEASIKQLVNKAVAGDLRAADLLLKYKLKYGGPMFDTQPVTEDVANPKVAPATLTLEDAARTYTEAVKNAKPSE